MDIWDLKKWRRKLGYSQVEAGEKFGVSRAAIQNWECERSAISRAVDLACHEIERRWKQRPEFGPVVLVYSDDPMWPDADCASRMLCMQRELYPNNDAAIRRCIRLTEGPGFSSAFLIDQDSVVVWSAPELLAECDRRKQDANVARDVVK